MDTMHAWINRKFNFVNNKQILISFAWIKIQICLLYVFILPLTSQKLNSFIDQKTAWIDQLDKTNIAKNAAHNIVPPKDPIVSLSSVISSAIGEKLQAAAPLLQIVTNKIGGLSSGGHNGFNLGSLFTKGFGASSGHTGVGVTAHGAAI